jgi:hypothetical protein
MLGKMGNKILRWQSDTGLEHAVFRASPDGLRVESAVIGSADDGGPFAVTYHLSCAADWTTREVRLAVVGDVRSVHLRSDGDGTWSDGEGKDLPLFLGCLDVDITATPPTNTLPIRRLDIRLGGSATIRTLNIDVPSLRLSISEQRYTRVSEKVYRFELTDGSFTRDIEVDPHGFVLHYPGLFRRCHTGVARSGLVGQDRNLPGRKRMDEDLEQMTRDELLQEVKKLRAGIRDHRDSTGQDLCWHHPALWGLLPEKTDPLPTVPEWPAFMRGCIKYRESLERELGGAPRTKGESTE